ncbi:hypothetical protein Ancab_037661 [Ancistrocladus abbreviatus]
MKRIRQSKMDSEDEDEFIELDHETDSENDGSDVDNNYDNSYNDYHDNEVDEEDDVGNSEEYGEESDDDKDDERNHGGHDDEMEELEKEYNDLRDTELNLLESLKRHKDEDLLKGQAVKNQKALWDKALELRFLLQKAFSNSNRLPQEPIRSSFCESDERVSSAYLDLIASSKKAIDSLVELQEAFKENNPSITQGAEGDSGSPLKNLGTGNTLDLESEEQWSVISQMQSRIAPFRNKSIDKWQRKTEVNTGAAVKRSKLLAFNQNISDQVATYMRDPSKMIKSMQMRRETIRVFGTAADPVENTKEEGAKVDADPELLDDSEFYQQLLKEFFETINQSSSETAFYALKRLQTKKRKMVDRRASKSRKIRYHVHEKIVNFMAPLPMDLPPMAPKLFENLFGLKTQKSVPAA